MASAMDHYNRLQRYQELGFAGIALSVLSSIFMSAGLCLQKLVQKNSVNNHERRALYKNGMYVTGVLYVCIGYVLRVTLYGFLPLSTLAPLSALTIVFSIILEYYILHDEMKQITIICSFFIIIGVGICSLSANIVDESYSLKSLQSLFFMRFNFIMTISLGAALLCCKQFLKLTSFFLNKEENNNLEKRSYNRISGNDNIDNNDIGNNTYMDDEVDSNNDNINDKLNRHNQHYNSQYNQQNNTQNERENTHTNNYPVNFFTDFRSKVREDGLFLGYLGFFYLIFANALITGWFSVSAKAMIEIIKTTFFDGIKSESLSHPGLIILLFLLPLCSCAKMKYTWYALTLYAPLQYIPLYQSAVIFINSVFGLVYFQDFSVRRIVGTEVFPGLYFGGLFCVCVPLAIMTFRYNPHQHYPSSTAIESVDDESQVLLDNSENDYGRNYGNGNSKTNSRSQNNGFNEFKNGFRKNLNADNYENSFQSSGSSKNDSNIGIGSGSGKVGGDVRYASPYRSYGASDILIKSSEKDSGMGVKIPSKITQNGTNDRNREEQEKKDELLNTPNRLPFSFSPSRYLSPAMNVLKNVPGNVLKNVPGNFPRNVPKKSDTFSGIACEVNGVEESAAGKGAPLALYVGSLQGINNLPLSASEDEKEGK